MRFGTVQLDPGEEATYELVALERGGEDGGIVIASYEDGRPLSARLTLRSKGHVNGRFEGQSLSRVRWLGSGDRNRFIIDRARITSVGLDSVLVELETLFEALDVQRLSATVLPPDLKPWANAVQALNVRVKCPGCPSIHYAL